MLLEATNLIIGQGSAGLFWVLILLLIIGSIIILVVGTLIFFIPAAVIAGVVYFLTGNTDYAGIAFLIVALMSILKK
jgi:hypothetical protein